MRVFLDTNVLAAGFATRGLCSDLIREVLENHDLVSSLGILIELKRILAHKFKVPAEHVEEVLDLVQSCATLAEPNPDASYKISDPDDIPHLSAAAGTECAYFVMGDKELWKLNPIDKMQVLSPRQFWEAIQL